MKKFVALLLTFALCLSVALIPAQAETTATPSIAIVVAGTLGDRSFYDSAHEGAEALKAEFGTVTKVLECREDASLYESSLIQAADECEIVAAVGWQFWTALPDVVAAYPDVKFLFIDNGLDGVGDPLMSIVYKQTEGSFLVGYIAAKLSKTGKVGVVGGEDSDTINDFIVGYEAGAKYADENVEVITRYANGYEDPTNGKEVALALYNLGCDIVYQVAGKTGEGVFEAAKETGNYAIGVDGDQKYINPDVILCSMVKRVGKSIYDVVTDVEGKFAGGTIWNADMATGYIDVVYGDDTMTQQVSDGLKAEVEELKAKIIAGEIVVPTALQ